MKHNHLQADWAPGRLKSWTGFVVLAISAAGGWLAWTQADPPAALPAGAASDLFSALRARRHIEQIARIPHPVGSPENARVRDYIVHELETLGIAASVERRTAFYRASLVSFRGGMVENIVARIPGWSPDAKAVMLACHYDSVVEGGGAADDASSVGVLLETARALRQDPPLRNDVLLLFTDGEEPDLMGSEAFISQGGRAEQVGLVLNFEARGTAGPALMFQTSQPDGALIREFARAAPHPRAASFFRHIYERMPSATDFTFFTLKGIPGLNFAFIEGGGFYHTSEDNLERLDFRAVQHQGSSALALTRRFGNLPLPLPPGPNMVYFNAGNLLVRYPIAWVWAIEGVLLVLWMLAGFIAMRRFELQVSRLWIGLVGVLGIQFGLVLAAYAYLRLLEKLHVIRHELSFGQEYARWWLLCPLLILGSIAGLRVTSALAMRIGRVRLCIVAVLLHLLSSFMLCWTFPAASHLGMAGVVTGLLLLGFLLCDLRSPPLWIAVATIALLPAILIWVPLARYLDAGLGVAMWPVQVFLAAQFVIFAGAALFPPAPVPSARPWLAAIPTAIVFLMVGLFSGYDERHPRPSNVFYAADADRHAAYWVTRAGRLDPRAAQVLGPHAKREEFRQISPFSDDPFWRSSTPERALPPPELDLVKSECVGGFRALELQARSPRGARAMLIVVQSDRATNVLSLNGRTPTAVQAFPETAAKTAVIDLRALPAEGMPIALRIQGCGKLLARVIDRSNDAPSPLPPGLMTAWEDDIYNQSVIVTRLFVYQ